MRPVSLPSDDLQPVAARKVQCQALAQAFGKVGEAAADQQHLQPGRLAGQHQFGRAGVELQARTVDVRQVGLGHALEQRHAPAQALLVIGDLAAHRGLGDGRHLGLAPGGIGNLVHALDVDEGGVHVERDQLEVAQAQRRREALDHEAGGEFDAGGHGGWWIQS
jgi:hypothetical protein